MKKYFLPFLVFLGILIANGCVKEEQFKPDGQVQATQVTVDGLQTTTDVLSFLASHDPEVYTQSEIKRVREMLKPPLSNPASRAIGTTVELPAGSVDALQAAVEEAGSGGTVIVKSGEHTENGQVRIGHRINIVGEDGAVIKLGVEETTDITIVVEGGILLANADKSVIKNIRFEPVGNSARLGLMIYHSNMVTIKDNSFNQVQFAILVEGGNHTNVHNNTIIISSPLSGPLGITVINGHSSSIVENHITGAQFGIWCCDQGGISWGNTTNNCFYGQIICKVPAGSLNLDGEQIGAERPGSHWLIALNEASNNLYAGIVAIDGAVQNTLLANQGTGNGAYDIDLVGDSNRFGFFTPTSEKNRVFSYSDQLIKDCGEKNKVQGGILVDNNTDPCM